MKYRVLRGFLRGLIYVKRVFWWIGARIAFVLAKFFVRGARVLAWIKYKFQASLKRAGSPGQWFAKRNVLQVAIFLIVAGVVVPESQLVATRDLAYTGQKTMAYQLLGLSDDTEIDVVDSVPSASYDVPVWKMGAINPQFEGSITGAKPVSMSVNSVVAGGTALSKPIILPGSPTIIAKVVQSEGEQTYVIQPGDTLGEIADAFSVSVTTILWNNGLTAKSLIRPGDVLKIPPVDGVMHTVKKGDTIGKIALLYGTDKNKIIAYNNLKADGSNLKVGERLVVPDGTAVKTVTTVVRAPTKKPIVSETPGQVATPPASGAVPSALGYVWPSGSRIITQYYSISHHAIDIGGPWQTPSYAAKAGTVEVAQCGWNAGYGCYVIINHGNGIKTLYGHHSKLLVSPGDYVEQGQVIALMGNTGNVHGVTGIHLHFEVIKNGARVNPLGYVK